MEGDGIQRLMLHCQHIFLFYLFLIILFSTVIWNLCFFCFFLCKKGTGVCGCWEVNRRTYNFFSSEEMCMFYSVWLRLLLLGYRFAMLFVKGVFSTYIITGCCAMNSFIKIALHYSLVSIASLLTFVWMEEQSGDCGEFSDQISISKEFGMIL